MKKILLSITIYYTILTATKSKRLPCYACLNSVCYSPNDKIFTDHQLSGQLAVDRNTNILYYHYRDSDSRDFTKAFDLNKANSTLLPINFTFAHAVDQTTSDLYSSGEKGIYKYNPMTKTNELFGLQNKTIWHMQYQDTLYYTEFQRKGVYTLTNKKSKDIPELSNYQIDDFVIDKRGDIYFMSDSTLYIFRNASKKAKLFEDEIYFLTTDMIGDAYFIQPYTRGIYKINYRSRKMIEVGAFRKGIAFKVVFDGDNHLVFYESSNKILYYLSPVLSRCTVTTRGVGRNRRKFVALRQSRTKGVMESREGMGN